MSNKAADRTFTLPLITKREFDGILAALRFWQSRFDKTIFQQDEYHMLIDIAADSGTRLTNREIDELCERLNNTA